MESYGSDILECLLLYFSLARGQYSSRLRSYDQSFVFSDGEIK